MLCFNGLEVETFASEKKSHIRLTFKMKGLVSPWMQVVA